MKYLSLLIILIATSFNAFALQNTDSLQQNELVVGVKQTPPFIFKNASGEYQGISIELWKNIANKLGYQYTFKEYDLAGLLGALTNGSIDVCINPLTVTSDRVEQFDFTQPFYITNLAIAVDKSGKSKWLSFIKNFFSVQFFEAVLLLLLVLLIFGVLVWVFEKDANKEEFGPGMKGVWNGLWWSAVTMTTVGYGDKSPKTTGGRIVALVWMFTAIIIISGFTASIASSLTVSELESSIESPSDLKKVDVVAVSASTGADYLKNNGINFQGVKNITEALKMLSAGDIDAVVYDEPIMRYSIDQQGLSKKITILPYSFATQYYSFALPKYSKNRELIDPVLLESIAGSQWKSLLREYNLDD